SDLIPGEQPVVLALALLVAVASSAALLLFRALREPRHIAWLFCLLDVVLVTDVVAATGGGRSIFAFLYVLSVTAACVLLSRVGGLVMAAASSVLYTSVVLARTVLPTSVFFDAPGETSGLELLTMFMNSGTFLVVAIVAGGLAERFRATRRELVDLQAFKDLVFQSVGTGLIALDRRHRVTAFNRAAEEITGRRAADAIGRPWSALFGETIALDAIAAAIDANPRLSPLHEPPLRRPGAADPRDRQRRRRPGGSPRAPRASREARQPQDRAGVRAPGRLARGSAAVQAGRLEPLPQRRRRDARGGRAARRGRRGARPRPGALGERHRRRHRGRRPAPRYRALLLHG